MNTTKLILLSCLLFGLLHAATSKKCSKSGFNLKKLKKAAGFLEQFGYLKVSPSQISNEDLECEMSQGIRQMQEFYGLPATGKMSRGTFKKMQEPRCGMADVESEEKSNQRQKRYVRTPWYQRWAVYNPTNLDVKFINYTRDMTVGQQEREMANACAKWNAAATKLNLRFHYKSENFPSRSAEVGIYHTLYDEHGQWYSIFSTTLARGYYPRHGGMYFNDWQTFATTHSWNAYDYRTVALHELGHIIGLKHSSDPNAIMAPSYSQYKNSLGQDDINGARALFP